MDLEYGPEYDDFRSEVINFIKENEDVKLTGPMRDESRVNWQQKLIDNGYFALPFQNYGITAVIWILLSLESLLKKC